MKGDFENVSKYYIRRNHQKKNTIFQDGETNSDDIDELSGYNNALVDVLGLLNEKLKPHLPKGRGITEGGGGIYGEKT